MSMLIQPGPEQTGLFKYCGKCVMCRQYYNVEPNPRPEWVKGTPYDPGPEMRLRWQTELNSYIDKVDTLCEHSCQFMEGEYVLACTCSKMCSSSGCSGGMHGAKSSEFITSYGRLLITHFDGAGRLGGCFIEEIRGLDNTSPLPIENPKPLTQEYLDILNNLLNDSHMFNGTLIQLDRSRTPYEDRYNKKLFYKLIYNFNKYQNMKEEEGDDEEGRDKELAHKDYIINFLEDELNGIFDKWEDCKKKLSETQKKLDTSVNFIKKNKKSLNRTGSKKKKYKKKSKNDNK